METRPRRLRQVWSSIPCRPRCVSHCRVHTACQYCHRPGLLLLMTIPAAAADTQVNNKTLFLLPLQSAATVTAQ